MPKKELTAAQQAYEAYKREKIPCSDSPSLMEEMERDKEQLGEAEYERKWLNYIHNKRLDEGPWRNGSLYHIVDTYSDPRRRQGCATVFIYGNRAWKDMDANWKASILMFAIFRIGVNESPHLINRESWRDLWGVVKTRIVYFRAYSDGTLKQYKIRKAAVKDFWEKELNRYTPWDLWWDEAAFDDAFAQCPPYRDPKNGYLPVPPRPKDQPFWFPWR